MRCDERGQTAAELMGVLALVVVIVAALAQSGIAHAITGAVERTVCSIASGGDCDDAEPAASEVHIDSFHHADGGGSDGPAFGDGPFPIPGIPWDGSVSYGQRSTDDPGVYLDASITHDRSKCRLDSEGKAKVDLGVTGTLRAGAMNERENRGKTGGVSVDAYVGRDVAYKVSTDPERADRISKRQEEPPSPVDPTSIPEGTTITLEESTYAGLDLSVSYRAAQAELGYSRGHRISSAVQRIDPDHVQVTVGDADLVQSTLALRVGSDDVNVSASTEKALAEGRLHQVDIDLTTPEGQRAYQNFIKTGALPREGKGVANERRSEVMEYSDATKLGGKLGDLEANLIADDSEGQVLWTERPDGTTTVSMFARDNEVGLAHNYSVGTDGRTGDHTYSLRLQDVPRQFAAPLAKQAGLDYDENSHDLVWNFDDIDMQKMRSAALDQLDFANPDYTRDEIKELIASGRAEEHVRSPDAVVLHIAAAEDPLDVARLIASQSHGGDSPSLAQWLFDFGERTSQARGREGKFGDNPEDAAIDDMKVNATGC
jgi:hypothetical protein